MKKAKALESDVITVLSLKELCKFCGADERWVVKLIQHGVVEPKSDANQGTDFAFEAVSVLRAKKARRLERDLGINIAGIALVLDLLDERDQLRKKLAQSEAL